MILKYDSIELVEIKNNELLKDVICIYLTSNDAKKLGMEVDLTGNNNFNEFSSNSIVRKQSIPLHNLIELKYQLDRLGNPSTNDIKDYFTDYGLIIGGEKDGLVRYNLEMDWVENLLDNGTLSIEEVKNLQNDGFCKNVDTNEYAR